MRVARRALVVALLLLLAGAGCWLAYGTIGAEVDAAGVLREPFALLPLGVALFVLAALAGLVGLLALLRPARDGARGL